MKDVLEQLELWRQGGEELAVATVVNTWGSAPRPVGSKMVTTRKGGIAGSVSAGCVEGAVIEEGLQVMRVQEPRLLTFGVADEEAWGVGLACGGTIQVFVEPGCALDEIYDELSTLLKQKRSFAVLSVVKGEPVQNNQKLLVSSDSDFAGNLILGEHTEKVLERVKALVAREQSELFETDESHIFFIETYSAPPRIIIVGAVHLADPLIRMAGIAGFETILIDPRKAFATRERFPHADQLVVGWPQDVMPGMELNRSAYLVILTHDPKVDDPALQVALSSDSRYVGALGSRRTNAKRLERLRKAGLSEDRIAKLHAPIGLDIGGRSPEELAVSILGEIIQVRNQPGQ